MNKYLKYTVNRFKHISLNKRFYVTISNYIQIENKNESNKSNKDLLNEKLINNEADLFGIGSKYANLDSKTSKRIKEIQKSDKNTIPYHEKLRLKIENISKEIDDSDQFGTLKNDLDDISFKTSVSYSKPLADSKFLSKEDVENLDDDEDEKKYDKVLNHVRLSNGSDRLNNENFYAQKMQQLAENGKIRDAIDVFYLEMIDKDRYKPTLYLYKILIRILARAGYTHMAFEVFKRLTDSHDDDWNNKNVKNIKQLHQIVTLLFLACSKSSWPEYTIRKTDSIRSYLRNRQITPNDKNYSAMISAYGKAGALYESFNVVDEMIANGIKPNLSTFNNLLCACISQPDYGFKYALLVWSMCLKYKIIPDYRMYNLLLKAANDCSININKTKMLKYSNTSLPNISNENKNLFPKNSLESREFSDLDYQDLQGSIDVEYKDSNKSDKKITDINEKLNDKSLIESLYPEITHVKSNDDVQVIKLKPDDVHVIEELKLVGKSLENQLKNLEWWQDIRSNIDRKELIKSLAKFDPNMRKIILENTNKSFLLKSDVDVEREVLADFPASQDTKLGRFSLIGGMSIIDSMKVHNAKPNFKTFNLIIQLIPNDTESEKILIEKMNLEKIKLDIDFINFLIQRRYKRKDYEGAKEAFKLIQENQLTPNIITFGALAWGVYNTKVLNEFLEDMSKMNFKLNKYVISTLYHKGMTKLNKTFLIQLFDFINKNGVTVDNIFITRVKNDLNKVKKEIISLERENKKSRLYENENDSEYDRLRSFYNGFNRYLNDWLIKAKEETKEHPYKKFAKKKLQDDRYYQDFVKSTEKFKTIDEFKK